MFFPYFFDTFSASIFGRFFDEFVHGFWIKMEPKWLPKWLQNPLKIHTLAPGFHFGASWLVLAPFWLPFGSLSAPFWTILAPLSRENHPFGHPFPQSTSRKSPTPPPKETLPSHARRTHSARSGILPLATWIRSGPLAPEGVVK